LFRLTIAGYAQPVAFAVNDHRFADKTTRIISFQNIRNELDVQELESWQKLIRVLTHEIMNSTGPISSSIDTIREFLVDETGKTKNLGDLDQETLCDVLDGIEIIKERSLGLSGFVQNFRSLTLTMHIERKKFAVEELFHHVGFLLSDELKHKTIELRVTVFPKNLEIVADRNLIEQVILNLVNNAMDALGHKHDGVIRLNAFKNPHNQPVIQVFDNGKGIPEDVLEKIFVPFFTTKESGSGIGLSLSRQIIQRHGGTILVHAGAGMETCFEICFAG